MSIDDIAEVRAACARLQVENNARKANPDLFDEQVTSDIALVASAAARYADALEFYASEATYSRPLTEYGWGPKEPIETDRGRRARVALTPPASAGATPEG